jgi:epoxyqueuosine reductase QueG
MPKTPLRSPSLESLWVMDDAGLERAIEGTALRRAGVRGLRRNLAVAIGNAGRSLAALLPSETVPGTSTSGSGEAVPGACSGTGRLSLEDPMVVEHINWARSQAR